MKESDKAKASFTSHHGFYQFILMPFGLKNAPATFLRFIDTIPSLIRWQATLFYVDDIIIFLQTGRQYNEQTIHVVNLLRAADVIFEVEEVCFFINKIDYFGHVIHPALLEVATYTADPIGDLELPTVQTELRWFMGFSMSSVSFYRILFASRRRSL